MRVCSSTGSVGEKTLTDGLVLAHLHLGLDLSQGSVRHLTGLILFPRQAAVDVVPAIGNREIAGRDVVGHFGPQAAGSSLLLPLAVGLLAGLGGGGGLGRKCSLASQLLLF